MPERTRHVMCDGEDIELSCQTYQKLNKIVMRDPVSVIQLSKEDGFRGLTAKVTLAVGIDSGVIDAETVMGVI